MANARITVDLDYSGDAADHADDTGARLEGELATVRADGSVVVYSPDALEVIYGVSAARARRTYSWALCHERFQSGDGGLLCTYELLARLLPDGACPPFMP